MTFNYSPIQQTALKQIADKGRSISVVYKTEGTLDIDNDEVVGDTEATVVMKGLVRSFKQSEVDGTIIQAEDMMVLVAASGITKPKTNDIVIDGTNELTIVKVSEVKPGDTPIIYRIQVRG